VLAARTTEVGRVVDAVVGQARALHERPDVVPMIADRYGLGADTVRSWLDSTSFVCRSAWDPAVADTVRRTLDRAGF